jgi:hypothetical protein
MGSDEHGVETTGGRLCVVCNQYHLASARCHGDPLGFSAERAAEGERQAAAGQVRPLTEAMGELREVIALRAELARVREENARNKARADDAERHKLMAEGHVTELRQALATQDAEREAAVLAMREACAARCEAEAERWEGDGEGVEPVARLCAIAIRSLPAPTAALDAERERVVRETVEWCHEHPAKRTTNDKCEAEKLDSLDAYLARALAAAKGGG